MSRIKLHEITTAGLGSILLLAFHGRLSECGNNGRASTDTLSEALGPVTNLTDMNRNIWVLRCRGYSKGVPLETGDIGDLNEKPLTSDVLETGLDNTKFHSTARMDENFRQASGTSCPDFPPDTLAEIEDTGPNDESPALITQAMFSRVKWEGSDVIGVGGVTDEATSGMGVKTDHEEECKMVGIPECFEALCADLVVGGRVHEKHDEEHEVTSDSTRLGIVDLQCDFRSDLSSLDIEEIDIVSRCVDHGPKSHLVSNLTMEPNIFISREQPGHSRTDDANDVAKHGEEDQTTVEG